MGDFLAVYEQALSCYKKGALDKAWQLLEDFEQKQGMRVLLGSLLKAYILRAQKKYVSEIALLNDLVQDFEDSEDKKRLADAYSLLGAAYRMIGQSEAAVAAFERSVQIEPDIGRKLTELSNALFAANAIEDLSAEKMQALYAQYRHYLQKMKIKPYPAISWQHAKIRVGYLSADLRDHAVGQFVRPFIFDYDTSAFTVFVYQLNRSSDFVTEDLRSGPVQWRNLAGKDFSAVAQAIREDEIDILVELGGHTAGNALPVLAYRAAPVQLSGIGYFNSTGLEECDGFLSDIYCAPEETSPYFTERLLRLPHTHFCYQPYKVFPQIMPPPCQKNGYITFGSFNNFAKVNDGMLCLWREILAQVPGARLLLKHQLLGTEEGRNYTLERLRRLHLPLDRIEMRPYSADYLREYGDMDIALDTAPYPGGLTTCEALYMGVPVVTLTGNRHGARFGESFLRNLGLDELVAANAEQYKTIAALLAGDWDLLTVLREKLRPMMRMSPLMDGSQYMRDLEHLYRQFRRGKINLYAGIK
ncbi:hypothetical protein [Selenomonas ruminantium]|uniref:O-linked N-acetylglucosamine transferase, SPINDLY family protein n=1 Tax=Selenomonas ruminantium TaxID=971 RepID=UPI0026F06BBB|nr:hypothetical protein [Selenomonas ruminantium]